MSKSSGKRLSNFELMRIVSMFMIVLDHVILKGGIYANSTGTLHIFMQFITLYMYLCMLILLFYLTGYFQHSKSMKFKMNSLLKIVNSMWFYKVVFIIIVFIITNILYIFPINKILVIYTFKL
jgi:hypothetical protein